jgi:hypothetical protein
MGSSRQRLAFSRPGKKCDPITSIVCAVHAGLWQAVMELPDISDAPAARLHKVESTPLNGKCGENWLATIDGVATQPSLPRTREPRPA